MEFARALLKARQIPPPTACGTHEGHLIVTSPDITFVFTPPQNSVPDYKLECDPTLVQLEEEELRAVVRWRKDRNLVRWCQDANFPPQRKFIIVTHQQLHSRPNVDIFHYNQIRTLIIQHSMQPKFKLIPSTTRPVSLTLHHEDTRVSFLGFTRGSVLEIEGTNGDTEIARVE